MTDNLTLNMDAYLPLRDVVFNTLREAILKGELKPGERLMELQLASKLGVSRTPIREAIRMLEQEGLAVTMPRKGAEVAKMTLKDMEDVLEVREAPCSWGRRSAASPSPRAPVCQPPRGSRMWRNGSASGTRLQPRVRRRACR